MCAGADEAELNIPDTWLNYITNYLIAVNRNTQYIYVVKVFVIVWVIYIHATCIGGWNNQDRIRIEKWFVFFFFLLSSGSHIENWHSVLRNGLVNASYTKLQVRNLGAERCLCSRTVNLPWEGRRGLAVRPNRFFFSRERMTASLLSALPLAFRRAGHAGRISFFSDWTACLFLLRVWGGRRVGLFCQLSGGWMWGWTT